ncbi:hypothetical protein INR49_007726 [Caranx melampygus]|nr:hypothetical protein INR49_007726 [Caranx melampygus]
MQERDTLTEEMQNLRIELPNARRVDTCPRECVLFIVATAEMVVDVSLRHNTDCYSCDQRCAETRFFVRHCHRFYLKV